MRRAAGLLATLLLCAPGAGWAGDGAPLPFDAPREGLEVRLGAGLRAEPAFAGARGLQASPLPFAAGGYGDWLDFDPEGATLSLARWGGLSAGLATRWRPGRHAASDRAQLRGLPAVGSTLEPGGFVAYEAGPLALQAVLTRDVARVHRGAVLDLSAQGQAAWGPLGLSAGPRLRVVSAAFAQAFHGIDAGDAATSGRPAFDAGGGAERAGVLAGAEWRLDRRTSVVASLGFDRLLGSAARSPLTRDGGSVDQWEAGLFLSYRLF